MSKEGQTRAQDSAHDTDTEDAADEQKAESRLPPPLLAQVNRLRPNDGAQLRALVAANPGWSGDIMKVANKSMGSAAMMRGINGKEDAKYAAMADAQKAEAPAHKAALTPAEQAAMLDDPSDAKHISKPTGGGATKDSPEQAATSPHTFQGAGQGRVSATGLNVRSTPDAGGHDNIIGGLHRGNDVQIVGRQGAWLNIVFEGGPAFVHGAFVEVSPAKPADKAAVEPPPAPVAPPPPPAPSAAHATATAAPAAAPKAIEAVKSAAPPEVAAHIEDKVSKPEAAPPAAPAPAPAPVATAPAPHAPAPAVTTPAPAAAHPTAPAAASSSSASAATSTDSPEYQHQLVALEAKILAEFDAGHIDQAAAVKQLTAFDQKHGGGVMTPAGLIALGALMVSLTTHEIAREQKTAAAHPHAEPSKTATTPHADPAGSSGHQANASTGAHATAPKIAPVEPVEGDSIASLSAALGNAAVTKVANDVAQLSTDEAKMKRVLQGEFKGKDRDHIVASIQGIRGDLDAVDKSGLDAAKLGKFVTLVNRKLQELAPYMFQGFNILTIETRVTKDPDSFYSTCNMTSLGMSLELLGKTAANYGGERDRILMAAKTFQSHLSAKTRGAVLETGDLSGSWDSLVGLRLPDFLELAAVAEDMNAATAEQAVEAQAKAKSDKILPGTITKLAARFGVGTTHKSVDWGSSELSNPEVESALANSSQRLSVESVEHLRDVADKSGSEKDRKTYETALAKIQPVLHGKMKKKDADTALPVAKYRQAVRSQLQPLLDGGAAIMVGAYQHWIRLYGMTDTHVLVQDPGSWYRHEQKVPWEEARAMGYFWTNLVLQ